jgi:hypothetical protein
MSKHPDWRVGRIGHLARARVFSNECLWVSLVCRKAHFITTQKDSILVSAIRSHIHKHRNYNKFIRIINVEHSENTICD